jgi:hypothetical protein
MDLKRYVRAHWDRFLAGACIAVGLLALLLGWLGMSGTALQHEQLPYLLSGGVVGAVLVGIGATILLSADLRDEWRKLDSLETAVRDALALLGDAPDHENADPPSPAEGNGKVAARRGREPLQVNQQA